MIRNPRMHRPSRPAARPWINRPARPEVERLESRALLTTAATVQATATDQSATARTAADFTPLATFTVPGSVLDSGPFQVSIAWGDGTVGQAVPEADGSDGLSIGQSGPIFAATGADPGASYTIAFDASHDFAAAGTYTYTVTFSSGDHATALASATGTITVAPGAPTVPPTFAATAPDVTATAGVPIDLTASFTGQVPATSPVSFDESATFGDGSTGGTFAGFGWQPHGDQTTIQYTVGHTYQSPGTYTYQVTLLIDGSAVGTATGTVTVVASDPSNPVVVGSAPDLTATAGVPVDLTPTFSGPDSAIGWGTFSESATFGDGSTDATSQGFGWQDDGNQVTYSYILPHVYQSPGTYTYQVTFLVNGSAVATATGTVTVVAGSPVQGGSDGSGTTAPAQGTAPGMVADPIPAPVSGPGPIVDVLPPVPATSVASGTPAVTPAVTTVPAASPFVVAGPPAPDALTAFLPDLTFEWLWSPVLSMSGATSASKPTGTTTMPDPLHPKTFYWDAGLELLGS